MADDLITLAEAVKLSGYNPQYIRRLIRAGKVKAQKFGIVWQVDRRSLLAYVKAAETSGDKRRGPKAK